MVRKGKGRQKIEMVKIKKESNLQVTFSKRRFGLFKKASELCTLCGVQILMIVFSPGGKAYSFGHPNARDLIYRFINHNLYNTNQQISEIRPNENIQYLNKLLIEEVEKQENEKKTRLELDKLRESREKNGNWYEKDVEELDLNETNNLISALQDVKDKLVSKISENYQINGSQIYFGESSSNNITPSGNLDVGSDIFDQRRMMDLNAFNYDPNMIFPNYRSSFGFYNNGVIVPTSNMNYMQSYSNFNQN